jgi:hypothetical protein
VTIHSTTEIEYIASYMTTKQLILLRKILTDLDFNQRRPIKLFCDKTTVITISKNSVFHDRTKHMKIKFHVVRQFQ